VLVSVLDPRSAGVPARSNQSPAQLLGTNHSPSQAKLSQAMGWARFHYGRGDLVVNRGAYFVSVQRWTSTNALNTAWRQWRISSEGSLNDAIGEDAFWTRTERFHRLIFRRGLFHVVVECGPKSDHSQLLHLAEVIDAKIARSAAPGEPARSQIRRPISEGAKQARIPSRENNH
jgi:hypothetical protein